MKIKLELFEEHLYCNFYSFIVDNKRESETKLFFQDLIDTGHVDDASKISYLLEKIGQNKDGAVERYFRPAGKRKDNVWELPDYYFVKTKIRLYCVRYQNVILVLGNGGLKNSRTYQEDPHLNNCVQILQALDKEIKKSINSGTTKIQSKNLKGKLEFYI